MDSIEEKRVYGDREGALEAYVASSMGVVRVRVAGDAVGEFSLCERAGARDIAATADCVAIATDDDVRVLELERGSTGDADGSRDTDDDSDSTFTDTGFGPAVAVGYDDGDLVAAGPDGTVACRKADRDGWSRLENETIAAVRAMDGDLIGTDSGVYRVHDGGLDHVGLTDVRDVAAAGVPLAATDEGLYKLGNGWMELFDDPFATVAAAPSANPGQLSRAHAVSDAGTLYAFVDDAWTVAGSPAAEPDDPVVALGYDETVYGVTRRGTFCTRTETTDHATDAADWRTRSLGITDVTGLAVPPLE